MTKILLLSNINLSVMVKSRQPGLIANGTAHESLINSSLRTYGSVISIEYLVAADTCYNVCPL